MIGLHDASVRFGHRTIFSKLNFQAEAGETLAVLGPNGRGKTTALRAMLGFQPLAEGRAIAPRLVGYVPQVSAFAHAYSVRDIVVMGRALALGLFGQPGPEDLARAQDALATVGMAAYAEQPFDRLSGGERQLVLLARALATGSPALVLDEPGAALDLRNQQRLLTLLARLRRAGRHAILFTTHDPNHALAVADRALMMMPDGAAVLGPVGEVLSEDNLARLYGVPMAFADVRASDGSMRRIVTPLLELDGQAA
jgi:iron complex transport system ATP-binding protein